MSKLQHSREQLQQLLDEAMKIGGQICEIDSEIERFEDHLMGQGWSQGNIKVGWTRGDIFAGKMSTQLLNRDRIFSLSSITSPVSLHLSSIQNEKTTPNDASRFYKKKKKTNRSKTTSGSFQCNLRKKKHRRGRPRKKERR